MTSIGSINEYIVNRDSYEWNMEKKADRSLGSEPNQLRSSLVLHITHSGRGICPIVALKHSFPPIQSTVK